MCQIMRDGYSRRSGCNDDGLCTLHSFAISLLSVLFMHLLHVAYGMFILATCYIWLLVLCLVLVKHSPHAHSLVYGTHTICYTPWHVFPSYLRTTVISSIYRAHVLHLISSSNIIRHTYPLRSRPSSDHTTVTGIAYCRLAFDSSSVLGSATL